MTLYLVIYTFIHDRWLDGWTDGSLSFFHAKQNYPYPFTLIQKAPLGLTLLKLRRKTSKKLKSIQLFCYISFYKETFLTKNVN